MHDKLVLNGPQHLARLDPVSDLGNSIIENDRSRQGTAHLDHSIGGVPNRPHEHPGLRDGLGLLKKCLGCPDPIFHAGRFLGRSRKRFDFQGSQIVEGQKLSATSRVVAPMDRIITAKSSEDLPVGDLKRWITRPREVTRIIPWNSSRGQLTGAASAE